MSICKLPVLLEKLCSKTRKSQLWLHLDLKPHKKPYLQKSWHFPALFLLQLTTAWLNCSFTSLAVLITGIDQKEKRVLNCAACSCEAVVLNCLSAPPGPARSLRFSHNVELPSVKGTAMHLEGIVTWTHQEHLRKGGRSPLYRLVQIQMIWLYPQEKNARVALNYQRAIADQTNSFVPGEGIGDLRVKQKEGTHSAFSLTWQATELPSTPLNVLLWGY